MKDVFLQIVKEHMERYPQMEPQDFGKLAFQSEFGPEHLITEIQQAKDFLEEEWKMLPADTTPRYPEAVSGSLCRFPLTACPSADAVKLLAELFVLTAKEHQGSMTGLEEKAEQLASLEIPGFVEWRETWKQKGYLPVHHSRAYRGAYHPHYRLLGKEYADYFPVLEKVNAAMKQKTSVIIAIDGRCGSGKTCLAQLIEKIFSCNVLHMDDFYLPPQKRQENWMEIPAGNMDLDRFYGDVLQPLKAGKSVCYRPYSCMEDRLEEALELPDCRLTVVEGSYSQHPKLLSAYDLTIFLTCTKEAQKKRLQRREGSYYPVFEKQWIPMEENYLQSCAVEEGSRLCVDTSAFF